MVREEPPSERKQHTPVISDNEQMFLKHLLQQKQFAFIDSFQRALTFTV